MHLEHKLVSSDKKTIFIVDDERIIADTLAVIMRKAGYEASAFYDPRLLLAAFQEQVPDLVLSDVVMPEMTGIQLAQALQQSHSSVRCILISGQAHTSSLLEEARGRGHKFNVLDKPVHPTDLLRHVRVALAGES